MKEDSSKDSRFESLRNVCQEMDALEAAQVVKRESGEPAGVAIFLETEKLKELGIDEEIVAVSPEVKNGRLHLLPVYGESL